MALNNWKTMLGESGFIFGGFVDFFKLWNQSKNIKRIKANHDEAWYNEYLKSSKKLKKILIESCNPDNLVEIYEDDIGIDHDMLELYLCEIYISHDVRYERKNNNTYIICLTNKYIAS